MKCAFNKKKGITAGTESDKLFAQETGNIKADDGLLSIGDSTPSFDQWNYHETFRNVVTYVRKFRSWALRP